MRKWMRIGAFVLLCAAVAAVPWAMRQKKVEVRDKIRGEAPVWEGAVSVGVVAQSSMSGAVGRLREKSSLYGEEHDGVLVSLREMTRVGARAAAAAATLPDVLVYAAQYEEMEAWLDAEGRVACVDAGGYALLGNVKMLDAAQWHPELSVQQTIELLKAQGMKVSVPMIEDLRPVEALERMGGSAGENVVTDKTLRVAWPEFVLEEKYALYMATEKELERMEQLRAAGRGCETVLVAREYGSPDQALRGGVVKAELSAAAGQDAQRSECARTVLTHLKSWAESGTLIGK